MRLLLLLCTAFLFSCKNNDSNKENNKDSDLPNGWTEEQKDEFMKDAIRERKTADYTSKDMKKYAECYFDELAPEVEYKEWRDVKDAAENDELTSKQKKTTKKIESLEKSCLADLRKKGKVDEEETTNNNTDNNPGSNWTSAEKDAGWQTVYANILAKGYTEESTKKFCDCYVDRLMPQMTYKEFIGANPEARISDLANKANTACSNLLVTKPNN